LPVPAQADEIDDLIEDDLERLRFGGPTIKERS
jgi:hypothetical protein